MANINHYVLTGAKTTKADMELAQHCFMELDNVGLPFPTNMEVGERRILIDNNDIQLTLIRITSEVYQFLYRVYSDEGTECSFFSAAFTVDVNNVNFCIISDIRTTKADMELVQICFRELSNVNMLFPTNMKIGERRVLIHNDEIEIVLRRETAENYQFFYHVLTNGDETTFISAVFTAEKNKSYCTHIVA